MHADYLIKNKVTEQDFEQIVYKWLAEGDYTPDDIIENIITQNNIVLVPLYYSKDDYSGNCSVSLGYQKQEYYEVWDDVNKRRVMQSRWITYWQPHSQHVNGTIVTICYAGDLVIDEIAEFIENMDWRSEELHEFSADTAYHEKIQNLFKVSREISWQERGYKKAFATALKNTTSQLPSGL